jgi:hypothetical protein
LLGDYACLYYGRDPWGFFSDCRCTGMLRVIEQEAGVADPVLPRPGLDL